MPIAAGDADPSVPNFLTPAMNFGDDAMQGLPAVWPEGAFRFFRCDGKELDLFDMCRFLDVDDPAADGAYETGGADGV
jgi:hypothetical protein